jgi:hypothetical protein
MLVLDRCMECYLGRFLNQTKIYYLLYLYMFYLDSNIWNAFYQNLVRVVLKFGTTLTTDYMNIETYAEQD